MHGSVEKWKKEERKKKYGGFQISCSNEKKMDISVRREKGSEVLVELLIGRLFLSRCLSVFSLRILLLIIKKKTGRKKSCRCYID
jgi:hypothetical protein